jgi:ATP-dependent RNA helicase DHX37/DHR1
VDTGKVKERVYNIHSGLQTYQIGWTSRASADQRAGRAGRMGPGHCYRLFSSAVFGNFFSPFSEPEILKRPIEEIVLQMKAMGIHQVKHFPFPTVPNRDSLDAAETLLKHLGALDVNKPHAPVTELGKLMACFPVSPRFSKMYCINYSLMLIGYY